MNMEEEKCIRTEDLGYRVNGKYILNGVSFAAKSGEITGVIGPNGAGKSTLVRLLVSVINPSSGSVYINGTEISAMRTTDLYRRIAFVPQNLDYTFPFTVLDTVLMGRIPYLGRFEYEKDEDYDIAYAALSTVDMESFSSRYVTSLSGGEKQLVAIATAIAQSTAYMVLDEPISNLDINHQLKIMNYLRHQSEKGKGVIVVLHDLGLAARFCDRLLLLSKGGFVKLDTPENVLTGNVVAEVFGVNAEVYRSRYTGSIIVDPVSTTD